MKVPTYDSFTVTPDVASPQRLQNAVTAEPTNIAARQMSAMGQAQSRMGGQIEQVVLQEQERANRLRVDDALNKARERVIDLTYNKDTGFTSQLGINALQRQSGKSLPEEYGEAFQKEIDGIASGLGNDVQREAFMSEANQLAARFHGETIKHFAQQSNTYELSVREGTISNRINEIGLNYQNPDIVKTGIDSIMAASVDMGRLKGLSAVEAEEFGRKNASAALRAAASSAIVNGDFAGATNLVNSHKDYMTADDALALDTAFRPVMESEQAVRIYDEMSRGAGNQNFSPEVTQAIADAAKTHGVDERLLTRIAAVESSGNPRAVNPSGATGLFQFTTETAQDYGLTDRTDAAKSADAAARLVRANARYLAGKLGREATPAELYLAHQQGMGGAAALLANPDKPAVEALAEAYGGDMGKATQAIVQNGGSPMMTAKGFADLWAHKLGMGGGEAVAQSGGAMTRDDILARAGGNPRVADAVMKLQREQITAQNEARKAAETEATNAAWRFEAANMNNPARWSTPEGRQVLQGLYQAKPELAAKFMGQDVETDWSVYQTVLEQVNSGADVHIQDYASSLSRGDMKALIDRQSDPDTMARSRVAASVMKELQPIIEGGEKDQSVKAQRVVMFGNKLDMNIREFMRLNQGKPPSRQEVQTMADQLLQDTRLVTTGGGMVWGDSSRDAPRFMARTGERPDITGIDRMARNLATGRNGEAVFMSNPRQRVSLDVFGRNVSFNIRGIPQSLTYDGLIAKLTADLVEMGEDASDKDRVVQHYNDLVSEGLIEVKTQ